MIVWVAVGFAPMLGGLELVSRIGLIFIWTYEYIECK
jgi:hypothetical protein